MVDIQRDIYLALAVHIKAFAAGGGWAAFRAFLPLGIVFGAVHALTPRASQIDTRHLSDWMAVLIVWFSLALVSRMLGSAGNVPALENLSWGLLGVIGLWMLWSAFF